MMWSRRIRWISELPVATCLGRVRDVEPGPEHAKTLTASLRADRVIFRVRRGRAGAGRVRLIVVCAPTVAGTLITGQLMPSPLWLVPVWLVGMTAVLVAVPLGTLDLAKGTAVLARFASAPAGRLVLLSGIAALAVTLYLWRQQRAEDARLRDHLRRACEASEVL